MRLALTASELVRSRIKQATLKAMYPGLRIGPNAFLGRDCHLLVADGSELVVGRGVAVERFASISAKGGSCILGENVFVGVGAVICAHLSIRIGQDVLIGEYVSIRDQDHRVSAGAITASNGFVDAPVIIGDNVWIGAKATITKGVTIGENSVVGAGAVVTHDVPPNSVAAGVPARRVRDVL
jgi:acetyltransferase-like isoleucine patch superfamily enzyme